MPSTRWGHSSVVTPDQKLLIIGGRNDIDVNEIQCFDPDTNIWKKLKITAPLPKPRRRHSCVCLSGSLVMFGGFDGDFYNDVNVLDLKAVD